VLVATYATGTTVSGYVYRTTTAGSRPWDIFPVYNCDAPTAHLAGDGVDFDISPSVLTDSCVLFGDDDGQVFFSADLGATWSEVRDILTPTVPFDSRAGLTYVAFDPGFATAGDPGENVVYAAATAHVGRCAVDPAAASQCADNWLYLSASAMTCCDTFGLFTASGIEAVGDTVLYVADVGDADHDSAVWRTVDALALINEVAGLNLVEWSLMYTGIDPATTMIHPKNSDDLWVTQGSNDLWVLDSKNASWIWMWADPLAAPVALVSPVDGGLLTTTTTATLQWSPLDAATCYEVALYYECPECLSSNGMLPVDLCTPGTCVNGCSNDTIVVCGQTCLPITGLTPGMKYFWKVRVACDHPLVSKWSELYSFNTALAVTDVLCSPKCGEKDVILTTNFAWDVVAGATSYELQIVAASADGTADFTGATTFTSNVNALASIPGLEYSTVYYWRVRAINNGVAGGWATCLFTTMDEPEECPSPITPVTIVTEEVTPVWIWVIIGIGGALTIVVIILIVTTRKAS